jgi:hypothetical protein
MFYITLYKNLRFTLLFHNSVMYSNSQLVTIKRKESSSSKGNNIRKSSFNKTGKGKNILVRVRMPRTARMPAKLRAKAIYRFANFLR